MRLGLLLALLLTVPARGYEVCAAYANTADVLVPVGDGVGKDAEVVVPVKVPVGAEGVCGWKLGAFSKGSGWVVTAWVLVDGEGVDHYKTRGSGQQEPVMLPGVIKGSRVELRARFFNEGTVPVKVRVNAWVWFAMKGY